MQLKGLSEAAAYELMRGQATKSRLSLGDVAARIAGTSDVLGGLALLSAAGRAAD